MVFVWSVNTEIRGDNHENWHGYDGVRSVFWGDKWNGDFRIHPEWLSERGDLVHVYGNFEEHHDDKWSQTHASILGV